MAASILVVDDDESVAVTLSGILDQAGYRAEVAGSADEALRKVDEVCYDAALVDLRLGEDSGLSVIQRLRQVSPRTVSLVLTGYGSLETAVQALRLGASDYLLKPCDVAELKTALARGLDHRATEDGSTERFRNEFLSVAAHELKTPLTSLRIHAQSVVRQYARTGVLDPPRLERALQTIDQQAGKLSRLIAQLLDVSRVDAGKLVLERERADLVVLVEDTVALIRPLSHAHTIVVQAPPRLDVVVDRLRLEQVLANVLENAVRHNPSGGVVEVEVARTADGMARLGVRDHGVGIDPADDARVFERFSSLAARQGMPGLGLGLYLSRQIVELHGGRIVLEHPADGGLRIVISLPLD